jgi:type IV secretory pathway TrbF-like protein
MVSSRKTISNEDDRYRIELGEARVLFCTYEVIKQSVLTKVRIEWLEKRYGRGSVERIRYYMVKLQSGELE